MSYLALSFVAAGVAAPIWGRARMGEFLAPAPLIVSVWSLTFGLYLLRLLPYAPPGANAVAAIVVGMAMLLLGIRLGWRWTVSRPQAPVEEKPSSAAAWIIGYGAAGLLGLAWYVYLVHQKLGLEAFAGGEIRRALQSHTIPSSFLFLEFFCIATPLVGVAAALSGQRLRARHWFIMAACCLGTWISTDRTQFFTIVLAVFFMYVYRHGRTLSFTGFCAAGAIAAVLLAANFIIVAEWMGKSGEKLGYRIAEDDAWARRGDGSSLAVRAAPFYLYATGSYAALSVWADEEHPKTYGLRAIYPVARLLQRAHLLPVGLPRAVLEFVPVLRTHDGRTLDFNGYTFLYYPLQDFGLVGVVFYCLAIGVAAGAVHRRVTLRRDSALWLLVMSQIAIGLVLSVFVNKFNNTASWYILVVTVAPFLPLKPAIRVWARKPC